MQSEFEAKTKTQIMSAEWGPCDDDEDVADDDGGHDEGEGRADGRRVQEGVAAVRGRRTDVVGVAAVVNLHPQPTAL